MKISVAPSLFDRIPGLCIGIVAVRAADNAAANMEAEAFRRRCCTEANLLLKMDPALAEKELEDYREILSAAGVKEGRYEPFPCRHYKRNRGTFQKDPQSDDRP
mgnify:CR=1 FL=1